MGTKLYVGNLSFNTTENELQELFSQAGTVQEVMLMQDKFTGKSRGFAFVTMSSDQEAQNAITQFNGKTIEGRPLTVNEARPREPLFLESWLRVCSAGDLARPEGHHSCGTAPGSHRTSLQISAGDATTPAHRSEGGASVGFRRWRSRCGR